MFSKDAYLFERLSFLEKTANMIMKNTLENGMRSGSDYFAIWAPFWMLWEPFCCVLGGLGRLLAVFWTLLECSWTLWGRS